MAHMRAIFHLFYAEVDIRHVIYRTLILCKSLGSCSSSIVLLIAILHANKDQIMHRYMCIVNSPSQEFNFVPYLNIFSRCV